MPILFRSEEAIIKRSGVATPFSLGGALLLQGGAKFLIGGAFYQNLSYFPPKNKHQRCLFFGMRKDLKPSAGRRVGTSTTASGGRRKECGVV